MLSVAKLTLGQEAYYEQQVVRGLDDYYAGRGESPGIWAGRGAAELELSGVVEDGELGTLLRGIDPATKKQLRRPVRERTNAVRTLDLDTGRWVEDWKAHRPVSGFDLVFSCPKSVSLLHALTDDERVRREISEAHETSWQAAVGYLEREACVVRRGKGGKRREHGQGFVAAAFRHRTSRGQTATGVPSGTLHRLLLDAEREGGLPHGCVLLVDEAGMAETRVLAPVLELVHEAKGRAILVGDRHQLPSVGAGGLYPALC